MRSDRYKEEPKPKKKNRTLRIVLVLIVLLIAAIAASVAYSYKTAKDSISLSLSDAGTAVEFGEKHAATEYVLSSEGEVTPESEYLDTDSLGDKELVYTVSKPVLGGLLRPSGEYTLSYSVVDSTPPLRIRSGDGAEIGTGSEFDIDKIIAYGDNADPKPQMRLEGEVDTETPGDYPLHVTVTDSSGNMTDWDLTVKVVDEFSTSDVDSEKTSFADFVEKYKGEGRSFGIDVSEWQQDIDFQKVKDAGCEFVIIRVGYNNEKRFTFDSKFDKNIKEAKEAGLKVGLYMYSYDNSEETLTRATDRIITRLNGEKLDLPIAFDWEDFGEFQSYGMSFYELNRLYDIFARELGKAGYDTMLYGSLIYLEDIWADRDTRPIWLAQYADETDYKDPYMIWQASQTGRIKGIDTDVDLDIMMPSS